MTNIDSKLYIYLFYLSLSILGLGAAIITHAVLKYGSSSKPRKS